MNFGEIKAEVAARGFDYLLDSGASEARLKRWINLAYTEVIESDDWPWLRTTTTTTAPATITDLGSIENVFDTTNDQVLAYRQERDLIDLFKDITDAGTARYYYMTSPTTMAVYPVDTTTQLRITYWKVPTELYADSDEPAFPARYHMALVEYAAAHAYKDSDNPQMMTVARAEGDRIVQLMRERLLVPSHQNPDYIQATGSASDS